MKYIARYIKKICPEVAVTKSKTSESEYFQMGHNFVVRLSEHVGWYEKGKVSVVKSFNTDDFIVLIDTSPFPLIKSRKEVKHLIKSLYEFSLITSLSKDYHLAKQKEELEEITEWDKFWSRACQLTPNARYLNNAQKVIIKKYFEEGIKGGVMIDFIKKIKPTTNVDTISIRFEKHLKRDEKDYDYGEETKSIDVFKGKV